MLNLENDDGSDTSKIPRREPRAGNPHVRFDERADAPDEGYTTPHGRPRER